MQVQRTASGVIRYITYTGFCTYTYFLYFRDILRINKMYYQITVVGAVRYITYAVNRFLLKGVTLHSQSPCFSVGKYILIVNSKYSKAISI